MHDAIAFIGFGEAAAAFASGADWSDRARAYDRKTDLPGESAAKWSDYAAHGIAGRSTPVDAADGAGLILSLVTADQAIRAAAAAVPSLAPGALFFDGNSVSPETKRAAARLVAGSGARYIDLAILAPVHPLKLRVPLLVSGPEAETGAAMLAALGFENVVVAGPGIGDASAIKMIRSVVVKGLEALTAECLLAAARAGVVDAVIRSLDASSKPASWGEQMDYALDRMLAHGSRRAAEMEEVAKTLEALGVDPAMTRGTIERQRELGALGIEAPTSLAAKLAVIDAGPADIEKKEQPA